MAPPASSSSEGAPCGDERSVRQRLSWAQLLARVFLIDVLRCPTCGGRRRIVSFLTEPKVVRRILNHLGLPSEAPAVKRARVLAGFDAGLELAFDMEGEFPDDEIPADDTWEEDDRAPP